MLAFTAASVVMALPANTAPGRSASLLGSFVRNAGQWDPSAKFVSRTDGADLWVTDTGYVVDFHRDGTGADARRKGHVVRVSLVGAKTATSVDGVRELPGAVSYLRGKGTQAKVAARFEEVRSTNVLSGVDARYYVDGGRPRYDLIVRPGADASAIKLNYEGAQNLRVSSEGRLQYDTALGVVEERGLFVYQNAGNGRKQISANYVKNDDGTVSFKLGAYDASKAIVIDPVVWGAYTAGTTSDATNATVVAANGDVIVAGTTSSTDFPTTSGAYDTTLGGSSDAFVARYATDGATLKWSTLLGGSGDEVGRTVALTSGGAVVVGGSTTSTNFPTAGTGLVSGFRGVQDGFVSVINGDTGASLTQSSYLGGALSDVVNAVSVVGTTVHVVGNTSSTDYPVITAGERTGIQTRKLAGQDGFYSKFNVGGGLTASTYLGSGGNDEANDVVGLSTGAALVGGTAGNNVFLNAWNTRPGLNKAGLGGVDGFVVGVSANGLEITSRTYVGGSGTDSVRSLITDSRNNVVVAGNTTSANLVTTAGLQTTYVSQSGFVQAFNDATLASIRFGTYLGRPANSTGTVTVMDIANESTLNYFVVGSTTSPGTPLRGFQSDTTLAGTSDGFILRLAATGTTNFYSSLIGGTGAESVNAVAFDATTRRSVVVGTTTSNDFPTTAGSVSSSRTGTTQGGFVAKFDTPATLNGLRLNPIAAPYAARFEVLLDGPTFDDYVVSLSSNNAIIPVPSTTTITSGSIRGFNYTLPALNTDQSVTVSGTGSGGAISRSTTFVYPAPNVTLTPAVSTVKGGQSVTVNVGFASSALTIPVNLTLVDGMGNPLPASVATIVGGGAKSLPANSTTLAVQVQTSAQALDGLSFAVRGPKAVTSSTVAVEGTKLSGLTLSTNSTLGGNNVDVTVTADQAAPAGGLVVNLSSDSANLAVPATATIPEGQTSVTVTATTSSTPTAVSANVSASYNASTQSAAVTLNPVAVTGLTFARAAVVGGTPTTGTLTIDQPAGDGGAVLPLVSNNANLIVPATVTVPAGQTSVTFPLNSLNVTANTVVSASSTYGSSSASASITLSPIRLLRVTTGVTTLRRGRNTTVRVTLNGIATSDKTTTVSLSPATNATLDSGTVIVATGTSSGATILRVPSSVPAGTVITVTATWNGRTSTVQVTITD